MLSYNSFQLLLTRPDHSLNAMVGSTVGCGGLHARIPTGIVAQVVVNSSGSGIGEGCVGLGRIKIVQVFLL